MEGGGKAPAPAPAPTPTPTPTPTPPAPTPEPITVPEAPTVPTVPELPDFVSIESPEAVISAAEAAYESVSTRLEKFGDGIKINLEGEKKGIKDALIVYVVTYDNKPKFVIDFDMEELCNYDCPHCYNKIKDDNEEGVDCGGSCALDCQGQIQLPKYEFKCGDGICSVGEECLCNKDCGRMQCTKLTFDSENFLSWLLIIILTISGFMMVIPVTYPKTLSGLTKKPKAGIEQKLEKFNQTVNEFETGFENKVYRNVIDAYKQIRKSYKKLLIRKHEKEQPIIFPKTLQPKDLTQKLEEQESIQKETYSREKIDRVEGLIIELEHSCEISDYGQARKIFKQIKEGCEKLSENEKLEVDKKLKKILGGGL